MESRHTGFNSQNDIEKTVNIQFVLWKTGKERMQLNEGTGWKACYDEERNLYKAECSEEQNTAQVQNKKQKKPYWSCFWLNNVSIIVSFVIAAVALVELFMIFLVGLLSFSFGWTMFGYAAYRICSLLTKVILITNIVALVSNIVFYNIKSLPKKGVFMLAVSILLMAEDAFLIISSIYYMITKFNDVGYQTLSGCIAISLVSLIFALISVLKNRKQSHEEERFVTRRNCDG